MIFPATAESRLLDIPADYVPSAAKLILSTWREEGLIREEGGTLAAISISVNCATLPENSLILSAAKSTPTDLSDKNFDEANVIINKQFLEACDPENSLPKIRLTAVEDNLDGKILFPDGESFAEVILDRQTQDSQTQVMALTPHQPRDFKHSSVLHESHNRVVGTIFRTEEMEPVDFSCLEANISESREPVFRGQAVPPEVNTTSIEQWVQTCNVHHDPCRLPALATAREHDIYLVDVQDYRIIPATLAKKYVALSYVWGPTMTPVLTRDTILQCCSIGGLNDLMVPQTIMDAVQLVRSIGMRYLWVDSLCIEQDDDNKKQQQLTIMDSIYASAELLIVAAAGSDANAGLPGIGSTPRRILQGIENISGVQLITAQSPVQQVLKWSAWNRRGWTFQEAVLSRRALVFTESLVYWCCQVTTWREDMSIESTVPGLALNETNSLWPHQFGVRVTYKCRTSSYCQLAQDFSPRALKEESDVIWAFIGILRQQKSRFPKGFIWGLPYERLDATLLWSECSPCVNFHSQRASHLLNSKCSRYLLKYPSWSWLSTNQGVSFKDTCGDTIVSNVTWDDPLNFGDERWTTYLRSMSLEDSEDRNEENRMVNFLASSTSEQDIMDFGLLHFTAQTAVLTLSQAQKSGFDTYPPNRKVEAIIYSPERKPIGKLIVPFQFFNEKSERTGEFVLLSSNAEPKVDVKCKLVIEGDDRGGVEHVKGCSHIQSRNIMLIEWDGDVAYRRGLATIYKAIWDDIETEIKTIVLG